MRRTSLLTAPLACWLALMVPQGALAAGGPVAPVQGSYIGVPGSPYRYAAFDARGNTVVKRQEVGAGPAVSEWRVAGRYGIPGVDYSGSTTGLSADGRTLILAALPGNGPPRTTRLLVFDTTSLAVPARLTLRGWSTVDAISPDGRWLYLIHYVASDISRYEVQAYDLSARRLLAKPVVDPRDRGEAMTGVPINRVMSANGRWAYTFYLRPSGVPFVHALDTAGRRAVCIDLPSLSNVDTGSAHLALSPGGTTLQVDAGGGTVALIDTHTFKVSAGGGHSVAAPVRPAADGRRDTRGHGDVPWELIVLSVAALGVVGSAAAGVAKSRRHRLDGGRGPEGATVTDLDPQPTGGTAAGDQVPVA
ncbi:MAG: YncE family protein [Solirubrobacteraceae bacterium]